MIWTGDSFLGFLESLTNIWNEWELRTNAASRETLHHTTFTIGSTYVTWFFLYIMSEDGANTWSLIKLGEVTTRQHYSEMHGVWYKTMHWTSCTKLTTPISFSIATSFSNCLGYLSKSSPSANWVGLTNMEAMTTSFCDRAARAREICPGIRNEQNVHVMNFEHRLKNNTSEAVRLINRYLHEGHPLSGQSQQIQMDRVISAPNVWTRW